MKDIIRALGKRRELLANLLKNTELEPSRQHQVYGSIMELDFVLRCLNDYCERAADEKEIDLVRIEPDSRIEAVSRVLGIFRR
jgi:hypothetical protein